MSCGNDSDEEIQKNIHYHDSYSVDDPEVPGFCRFYSADRRFPVSISVPHGLDPFFQRKSRDKPERYLHVDFLASGDVAFSVAREDLSLSTRRNDLAKAVIAGRRDLFDLMEYEFAQKQQDRMLGNVGSYRISKNERDFVLVGAGGFRAPRVIWHTSTKYLGGEWVFFQSKDPSVMWLITWEALAGHDEQTFRQVLSSFRWLDEPFFRSLPT